MAVNEKLVELKKVLCECLHFNYDEFSCDMSLNVDLTAKNLIAHGVTIVVKKEKKPTDLTAKCGSCVYAKPVRFGRATCYVCCTHPNRHWNRRKSQFRQRTTRACKSYKPTKGE